MNNETKVKHCGKFPFHPDTLQIGAFKAQPKSRTCVPCLRLHFGPTTSGNLKIPGAVLGVWGGYWGSEDQQKDVVPNLNLVFTFWISTKPQLFETAAVPARRGTFRTFFSRVKRVKRWPLSKNIGGMLWRETRSTGQSRFRKYHIT